MKIQIDITNLIHFISLNRGIVYRLVYSIASTYNIYLSILSLSI